MINWNTPEVITRTGASHARRGSACQDASGRHSLKDCDGQLVHLMVVADGHGGKRYTHSDVGSRLACELSLKLVAEQLGQWGTLEPAATHRWREWLEAKFPTTLHQTWLSATENHWRQAMRDQDVTEKTFSPQAYGTTIALVIMAPGWWGHTGLGDWDLVRIGSGGVVELVNEELEEEQTGGEATYSLCLNNAPRHFASRTEVHPITEQQPSFSLLLSTDGVRKSCSTDADFLAIARYLCEAEQPRQGDAALQLNADLDRISSQGSGDDVSVAIGRWLLVREKSHRSSEARRREQRLQTNQPLIVQPGNETPSLGATTAEPTGERITGHASALIQRTAIAGDQGLERKCRKRGRLLVAVFVVLSAGALGFAMARLNLGPFSGRASSSAEPSPELVAVLRKVADDLCQTATESSQSAVTAGASDNNWDPVQPSADGSADSNVGVAGNLQGKKAQSPSVSERKNQSRTTDHSEPSIATAIPNPQSTLIANNFITGFLTNRKQTFEVLARRVKTPDAFLGSPSKDPTGALIAWSFLHPSLDPIPVNSPKVAGIFSRISGILPHSIRPGGIKPSQSTSVVFCPELIQALSIQRKRAEAVDGVGRTSAELTRRRSSSYARSNQLLHSHSLPVGNHQQ